MYYREDLLRCIEALLIIVVISLAGCRGAYAQPALKMGYSGAGVAQSPLIIPSTRPVSGPNTISTLK